jgi:hypothetical protein
MPKARNHPVIDATLRSSGLPFQFIPMPEKKSKGVWEWDNVYIADSIGKGKGLFINKGQCGLLIPYGGVLLSHEERTIKLRSRRLIDHYTIDGSYRKQQGIFDASGPNLHLLHWPAALVNEPSEPQSSMELRNSKQLEAECFNSRLCLLDRTDRYYRDKLPPYPSMPNARYLWFLELMVTVKRPGEEGEGVTGPIELLAHYGRSWSRCIRTYHPLSVEGSDHYIKGN